jgi:hypothetical protein
MFEHFRAWLKNPRIVENIGIILAVIVFVAVLKYFNLYEGFSKQDPILPPKEKFVDKLM